MTNKQMEERNIEVVDRKVTNNGQKKDVAATGTRKRSSSRKGGRHRNGKPSKSDGVNPTTAGSNDVRWYANSPELLRSAASLPFSMTTGSHLPWLQSHIPGVFTMYWEPELTNSAAWEASANMHYSFQVHANSRNTKYNAQDLMMVNIAGAQVFSFLALGIRTYGLMKTYSQVNSYMPRALVEAAGFDFDDLLRHLPNMWFDLNQLIAQTTQIWIPTDMPLIERWFWMNSHVYMDGDSIKSQFYQFAPRSVFKYNEVGTEEGATLESVEWLFDDAKVSFDWSRRVRHKWVDYVDLIYELINALIGSEDRGIMFGDALKAYGADKLYSISPITPDYRVEPVYDREVLSQIENATVSNPRIQRYIAQVDGSITYEATDSYTNYDYHAFLPTKQVLNFHQKETPTPEQIMVATRLKCGGTLTSTTTIPYVAGTERIISASVVKHGKVGTDGRNTLNFVPFNSTELLVYNVINDNNQGDLMFRELFDWSCFDWAPFHYYARTHELVALSDMKDTIVAPFGDYDYFTVIDIEDLQRMHITATYSELGVPVI